MSGRRCDRILWYGKGVKLLSYFRSESKFSDHRPVSALFSTQIEVMKSANPRFVDKDTIVPNIMPPEQIVSSLVLTLGCTAIAHWPYHCRDNFSMFFLRIILVFIKYS